MADRSTLTLEIIIRATQAQLDHLENLLAPDETPEPGIFVCYEAVNGTVPYDVQAYLIAEGLSFLAWSDPHYTYDGELWIHRHEPREDIYFTIGAHSQILLSLGELHRAPEALRWQSWLPTRELEIVP